ncbi:MAG: hypothetical protein Q9225_002118 [Loekoesia sp. 1 TL-2023]
MSTSDPPPKGLDSLNLPPSHDLPPQYEPPRTHTARLQMPPPEEPRARNGLDNESILPRYSVARYGIYGSEEEYLAALRAWVEEKSYVRLDDKTALTGFYGKETMQDYANRAGPRSSSRKKMVNNKEECPEHERNGQVSITSSGGQVTNPAKAQRRKSSIGRWLSHRHTATKSSQDGG